MKRNLIVVILALSMGILYARDSMTFVHPGGVVGQADLDFVKAKIAAGEQPWLNAYNQMKGWARTGTNPQEYINSNDNNQAGPARDDTWKAYANALTWYFTENEIYAERAIEMLNAWTIFQGFNGGNDQDMFRRAFYPQLKTASSWNGNVDLTQIDAMLNIAVFMEDDTLFNMGIERLAKRNPSYFYLKSDGGVPPIAGDGNNVNNFWSKPTLWIDGLSQETCRDNNHHAQFGMASALHAAEVAWNQGVDAYGENTDRYISTMELIALQILSGEMQGTCANNKTNVEYIDTWEVGFNHYHNRMGLEMPYTEELIYQKIRSKGWSALNIFYETLTHAGDFQSTIGIDQLAEKMEISIFPNPSSDGVFQLNKELFWEVYSSLGHKVKDGFGYFIDLSDQTDGLYLIRAENNILKALIQ